MSETLVPNAAARSDEARRFDGFSPGSPKHVVLSKVLVLNAEKYMVIDPLSIGPNPCDLISSQPTSAMWPYAPADGVVPKAVEVSMQPNVSEIFTTAAGHWDLWRGMVQ